RARRALSAGLESLEGVAGTSRRLRRARPRPLFRARAQALGRPLRVGRAERLTRPLRASSVDAQAQTSRPRRRLPPTRTSPEASPRPAAPRPASCSVRSSLSSIFDSQFWISDLERMRAAIHQSQIKNQKSKIVALAEACGNRTHPRLLSQAR